MKRVAVTGLGVVSSVGNAPGEFFGNLMGGRSGVRRIAAPYADGLAVKIAAEAVFDPGTVLSRKQLGLFDRTSQMAMSAAEQAWGDSGVALAEAEEHRAGVYFGTGMGGAPTIDAVARQLYADGASRVNPSSILRIMPNASAAHISIRYRLRGPSLTFATACSSSAVAIGEAARAIRAGGVDVAVAGGTESFLTFTSLKCWESLGVLAPEDPEDPAASCKPFAKDRQGLVLGEGAAAVLLEEMERARARGARIYGELAGYGTTSDAFHISGPDVDGQAAAMRMALADAGCAADRVGYINAHGTATELNDRVETLAIRKAFGAAADRIPVSSTKSMHGHVMGAGGAVEFVAALLALANGAVPPTANLKIPDPACDLDYVPRVGRDGLRIKAVMSNSFAFGGTNAVLLATAV